MRPAPDTPSGQLTPAAPPAFEALWARHRPQLARTARRLTGNCHDAEDLVQETGLRALRGYSRYEPGGNFPGWLLCILRNTHRSAWRRSKQSLATVAWEDIAECGEGWVRDTFGCHHRGEPEQAILVGVTDEAIVAALATLSEGSRAVFELSHLDGLTYAEIGRAMGLPIGTVRSRLFRARERLRHELAGYATRRGFPRPDERDGRRDFHDAECLIAAE